MAFRNTLIRFAAKEVATSSTGFVNDVLRQQICQKNKIDFGHAKKLVEAQLWLATGAPDVSEKDVNKRLDAHFKTPSSIQHFLSFVALNTQKVPNTQLTPDGITPEVKFSLGGK
jgi:hypothetical protein